MVDQTMTKFSCQVVDFEFVGKVILHAAVFSPSDWDGNKLGAKESGLLIVGVMVDQVKELLTEFAVRE